MSTASIQLINRLNDPMKEIKTIRDGINPNLVERFLNEQSFVVNDVLSRLQISKSTYFAKKKKESPLDPATTEKFLRLISVVKIATEIIGKVEVKSWLYKKIASLGQQAPLDLLDTEAGHRLVEETLLHIKYGVYS